MGKELLRSHPVLFKRYVMQSDRVSGELVSRISLMGSIEQLSQTHIAQPALFTYSLALTEYARQLDLRPNMVAGHSLGEYTAAVAAGALSFQEGLELVCKRGHLMKAAQDEHPGAMAAIVGLPKNELEPICQEISRRDLVQVTNWNAPEQLVVSGTMSGVQRLTELLSIRKGITVLPLSAKGAFHSSLMIGVQKQIREETSKLNWRNSDVPLVANATGKPLTQGSEIQQELIEQIASPVQWVLCMQELIANGCDTFIELGAGQVLTKLVRKIAPQATALAIDTPDKLEQYIQSRQVATQPSVAPVMLSALGQAGEDIA
ncbi:malonyl CoA-acyl carrier protein transacylase [Ktedonospora formicarum]|uniref:Malonyl CoA-acyl carrier protein transacylase n=2 Tax=Ktedonospora formicarum TaxID=2778364 RepID=A0A8J3I9N2_9CHLR|nr:malonyl CoA-acyl carrier protein transacylase [Ktedonospora formicarum]